MIMFQARQCNKFSSPASDKWRFSNSEPLLCTVLLYMITVHSPLVPYCGGTRVLTSICTTISAGSPPTAIMPGVGFLANVANFIVRTGGYFVRESSSAPGTGDMTSTLLRKKKMKFEKMKMKSSIFGILFFQPN